MDNAEVVAEPYNLCQGDGTWNFHSGHCACKAGFEADINAQTCNACPVGRYVLTLLDPFDPIWTHLVTPGSIWSNLDPFGVIWTHLE